MGNVRYQENCSVCGQVKHLKQTKGVQSGLLQCTQKLEPYEHTEVTIVNVVQFKAYQARKQGQK